MSKRKDFALYNFKDKKRCALNYANEMFNRTVSMFDYENLPETIPKKYLELYLQRDGVNCITEVNGELYCFFGGYGGELDEYYEPTIFTVANPYLNYSANLKRGVDCVVMHNDSLNIGLLPIFERYSEMLTECDITTLMLEINSRIPVLLSATDDRTRESARTFYNHMKDGDFDIVASNEFLDSLKSVQIAPPSSNDQIAKMIELTQYLKASWFNELGLQSNYNMKRESINSNESQLNDDMLIPLIDDMEVNRQIGVDEINKMYGTNIKVKRGSAWKVREKEVKNELTKEENLKTNESVKNDEG